MEEVEAIKVVRTYVEIFGRTDGPCFAAPHPEVDAAGGNFLGRKYCWHYVYYRQNCYRIEGEEYELRGQQRPYIPGSYYSHATLLDHEAAEATPREFKTRFGISPIGMYVRCFDGQVRALKPEDRVFDDAGNQIFPLEKTA